MNLVRSSLVAFQAILAISFLFGIYILGSGVAAALVFVGYRQMVDHFWNLNLPIYCFVFAGIILWSIFPRRDYFRPPGLELKRRKYSRLFKELDFVAHLTNQRLPTDVYLTPEFNAYVSQVGGFFNLGSRRVMIIGLPLLQVLTVAQFRAILAHEFGHYYAGDTRLSPLVYQLRRTIVRMMEETRILEIPSKIYLSLYLRITMAISRRQEYWADIFATRVAGRQNLHNALEIIDRTLPAWKAYWDNEITPMINSGSLPPLIEGFELYIHSPQVADWTSHLKPAEAKKTRTNPYDSHPPIYKRLAVIQELDSVDFGDDGLRAIDLFEHLRQTELDLLQPISRWHYFRDLKEITWSEAAEKVYIPAWKSLLNQQRTALSGIKPENLPEFAINPLGITSRIKGNNWSIEDQYNLVSGIVGAAITLALIEKGWAVTMNPGESVTVTHGDKMLQPFSIFAKLINGELDGNEWVSSCMNIDIFGIDLGRVTGQLDRII